MSHSRLVRILYALSVLTGALCSNARADEYPSKLISMVNGFAGGGTADILARIVADELSKELNQKVIVLNKPGAAGMIAATTVVQSPADGYTIYFGTSTAPINAALRKSDTFDLFRDLAPVTKLFSAPFVFVVNPKVPATNAAEFIAYAKSNRGKLFVAVPGIGSHVHLVAEQFFQSAGIELTAVPYAGTSQIYAATVSNDVQLAFDHPGGGSTSLQAAGQLRAIGVSTRARFPSMPDVPTISESGPSDYEAEGWYGLFFHAKVDKSIVDKLHAAAQRVMSRPQVRDRLVALGVQPVLNTPSEFAADIRRETDFWKDLAAKTNLKLE